MDNKQIRLNKFLAERLGISRREADEAIASGMVTIDGETATLGTRIDLIRKSNTPASPDKSHVYIDKSHKICYNGIIVPFEMEFLYLAFNKPIGYVCSRRAQGVAPTLYELLPPKYQKLKTVGRLDKDSSGLILLTNDGDFAFQMTHPKFHKEKIYEVQLDHPLEPLHQQMISDYGVMLDDGPSKFVVIKNEGRMSGSGAFTTTGIIDEASHVTTGASEKVRESIISPSYMVVLSEGRNRQIRRTFAALGYKVMRLHRTKFGKYQLAGLKPGKYVIIEP